MFFDQTKQIELFKKGTPHIRLTAPATVDRGIETFDAATQKELVSVYETEKPGLTVEKFVPASGAATRMFKALYHFLEEYDPKDDFSGWTSRPENTELKTFFDHLTSFPFYGLLQSKVRELYPGFEGLGEGEKAQANVKTLLEPGGLNYGALPKGLIAFRKDGDTTRTAFEEQLLEAARYAGANRVCRLHFTISESHLETFESVFNEIKDRVSEKTGCRFDVRFSVQDPDTDTIAVTPDDRPFTDPEGKPLFRPAGHGALLQNLNNIDADLAFIKNIDNVAPKNNVAETAHFKKVLAGKLLTLQKKVFGYVKLLEKGAFSESERDDIRHFLESELHVPSPPEAPKALFQLLNRPLRVCGMVPNTGAPGGGPFWVKDKQGRMSLQIVELSQVDTADPEQQKIVEKATHFNPVDLVCGLKNYKGQKFDLQAYTDPDTYFISEKSIGGKPIKALELPGLWNGAMAAWHTVFVEVPLSTFHPVKTVNDLIGRD